MPAASKRPNQIYRGACPFTIELNRCALLLQHGAVSVDDIQKTDRPFPILDMRQFGRTAGCLHGIVLGFGLVAQNAQAGEIVFDFAECRQHGLAIVGDIFFVDCTGPIDTG